MSLFGRSTNSTQATRLFGYRAQTSIYGQGLSIVLGTNRVAGNVIMVTDWTSKAQSSGGKGGGKGSGKNGGAQYFYSASWQIALCQGPCGTLVSVWQDKRQIFDTSVYPSFILGEPGQGPWSYLTGANAKYALGYSEVALACFQNVSLGSGGTISNYSFEVAGQEVYIPTLVDLSGGTNVTWISGPDFSALSPGQVISLNFTPKTIASIADATHLTITEPNNPATLTAVPFGWPDALASDAIYFLLTDFNCANLPTGMIGDTTELHTYCLANGIGISPVIDQQQTYASYLQEWLLIANSEAFSSEGLIKFRTYGDKTVTGNGVTFTPNLAPIYDLDLDDFLTSEGQPPITFTVDAIQDRDNHMTVEWTNRGRQYNLETMSDEDTWAIQQYGRNLASPITAHSVTQASVAQQVLSVQLKRSVYMLRKCQFVLGWKYSRLEPMDIVSVPEQYPSNGRLGVRLLTADEDANGNVTWTAEVLPFPILAPTIHPKQGTGGYTPGFNAQPGATNPPFFFEVTPDMSNTNFAPALTLLIALSGGPNWGGTSVWVSKDGGASYEFIDKQTTLSTMGFTTASLPFHTDPDTADTLSVNLQESLGTLASVAQSVADNFKSLILVDDELMSYETATLTAPNQYDLTYLRRGVFGSFDVPHASSAPFMAIDGTQFEYALNPGDIGKTFWFKFTAFNRAGQNEQDISAVTAYPFTVRGSQTRAPLPPQPSGAFDLQGGLPSLGVTPGMRLSQVNVQNSDPSVSVGISVAFIPPVNTATTAAKTPAILSTSVTTGGFGSIPAGIYLIAVDATVGAGLPGKPTDFALTTVVVPSNNSSITVNVAVDAAAHRFRVFAGTNIDQLYERGGAILPTSTFTFNTIPAASSGTGPLDSVDDHMVLTAFPIVNGGVFGDAAASYGSFSISFVSAAPTLNQFAGRKLKLYAPLSQAAANCIPLLEVTVLSNTAGAGAVFTLDTDPLPFVNAGLLSGTGGDVWVMRMSGSSFTANSFTDPNLVNSYAPSGLVVNQNAGRLLLAIGGTGSGLISNKIASNTATSVTVQGVFAVTPDSTTEWLIIDPMSIGSFSGASAATDGTAVPPGSGTITISGTPYTYPIYATLGTVPIPNQNGISVLIVAQASDSTGNLSEFELSPMQEAYIFGQPGNSTGGPATPYLVPVVAGAATPDASKGTNLLILTADTIVLPPINYSATAGVDTPWTLLTQEDPLGGTGGHSTVFDPSYFMSIAIATPSSPTNTQCHVDFKTQSTGKTFLAGQPSIDQPIPV